MAASSKIEAVTKAGGYALVAIIVIQRPSTVKVWRAYLL
jgi:hypothetical protein